MDQLPGTLVIAGILALWIVAFIRMQQYGGSKGVSRFFLCLFLVVVAVALLFLLVLVPVIGCDEIFCGLGEALVFIALAAIMLIAVPIIMMTAMVTRLKRQTNYKEPGKQLTDAEH
jgi:hypothetical protein